LKSNPSMEQNSRKHRRIEVCVLLMIIPNDWRSERVGAQVNNNQRK
jgi:hypothetical protein